jgi:hypothetical protein
MPRATTRLLACLLAPALVAGLGACGSEEEQPATGADQQTGEAPAQREPDQIYTVRGEVRQLPDPENPAASLQIRHEQIPDFVNRDGDVVGMRPMIMPFTPAPGLDLSGVSVGDKITFTFDVDWDVAPTFLVTEIQPLPPETELDFTAPPRPGG